MKRFFILFFAAIVVALGCKEDPLVPEKTNESIVVEPSSLIFETSSGTKMLKVKSPKTWTLSQTEDTDWCTPGITSGSGQSNFKVYVQKNLGLERSTTFTFTAEGLDTVTVEVVQKGTDSAVEDIVPEAASGITVEPAKPDADGPCTIKFNPASDNPLYGHTGELYGHFGVVVEGEWKFVPTDWGTQEEKTHFTKVGDNSWEFKMEPSIREYFQSGETPVIKIALIVRSADGSIKSHEADQFCTVVDNKYAFVPFIPDPVVEEPVPAGAKYGINYNSDNSVTFVLYDKGKDGKCHEFCYIVGDWNNWEKVSEGAMKRDNSAGCWWIKLDGFETSKEYRFQYRLGSGSDADIYLSDPYSRVAYSSDDRYIEGTPEFPENARQYISAFQIDYPEYPWKHKDFKVADKNDLVIYEMHFRDFSKTKNIAGAMSQLDYISNLGVTAVELMPIQEFDGNLSWGYDPNHWFALDKQYGTREQYKEFIDECHARGIAVIVDVVYNHATGAHPLAKLWWNSATNKTADNNPWFNVNPTHPYNVFHDMNHEEPMVKAHVKESLEYLLTEYDIDGFRFDLTKGFTQKDSGGDNGNVTLWGNYDQSRVDILTDYADHVWSVNPEAVVIFEHLSDYSEEVELAKHGIKLWRNMNHSYRTTATGGNADFSGSYESSNYGAWVSYMESHDEERTCYGAGADVSGITWGIIGIGEKWGNADDKKMTRDGMFFSVKNVTVTANDRFKVRKAGVWDDAYNYGASSDKYKLTKGKGYVMTNGNSSKDMCFPAAGTYDIYFCLETETIWVMAPGERPADPALPGQTEDPLTVAMRRAGANAAFFLTVPGPKMIWQFGEIGYDYTIEHNGRTGEKPVVTDEYMAVPARKALYDTYAVLLKFRRENPRFFDSDASFKWDPRSATKTITCSVDGKSFHVVGNFGKSTVSYSVPSGSWTDYINGGSVSGSISLKEGEFRLLTK